MNNTKFKQTEVGEIPEEWEVVPLDKLATPLMGQSPSSQYVSPEKSGNSLPFYQGNSEFDGKYLGMPKAYCSEPTRIAEANNILISVRAPVGAVSITKERASIGRGLAALSCTSCNSDFLFYYLLANEPRWGRIKQGSTFESVNKKEIHDFLIGTPKLEEQIHIASVLSCVDSAIQQTDEVITQARILKKGLMQELLTRGIGHKKFKETEIGEIPEEWEVVELGKICDIKGGKRLPLGHTLVDTKTNHPYIRVVDFKDQGVDEQTLRYLTDKTFSEISRYTISSKDVYISIAGTIGLVGTIPENLDGANLTENAAKLCNLKSITNEYIASVISAPIVQNQIFSFIGKTSQPKLALFRIAKLLIPILSLDEQRKISQILLSAQNKIKTELETRSQLELLKKGLMQDLLTGRIRFPEFAKGANS